jgi:hypothetical protein
MASKDSTNSRLTTEADNMAALHKESDLQGSYDSRQTDTGFLTRASRLPNCVQYILDLWMAVNVDFERWLDTRLCRWISGQTHVRCQVDT